MIHSLALLALVLGLAAPGAARAKGEPRVAIVPIESVAGVFEAREIVSTQVALALAARGVDVVSGEPVEEFLRLERARYFDSLDLETTRRLAQALEVDAVLFGQVLAWEPRPQQRDPLVAIAVTLVSREGEVLWSNTSALSGAEMENALAQGRVVDIEPLSRIVVRALVEKFPVPLRKVREEHSAGAWGLPNVHRSAAPHPEVRKVLVLPIENFTEETGPAARVLEALLQRRLTERADVEMILPGQMRKAIVARGLPPPWMMTNLAIGKLAQETGVRYVLAGSILSWGRAPSARGASGWEVEVHLELTDVEAKRVVWTGVHKLNGADSEGFLKRGAISTLPAVADQVVAELLEAFTR